MKHGKTYRQAAEAVDSKGITREIRMKWAQSGSDAMDLVLKRGQDALERGENDAAIEHFSAVIDHAPDFAEAYRRKISDTLDYPPEGSPEADRG